MRPPITVMIIEDNLGDARLIREQLLEGGASRFDIRHAGTLEAALEAMASSPADIALLDLSLPDAKGLEGLLRLRAAHADLPIIILTGLNDEEFAVESTRAGAQDYLIKGESASQSLGRTIRYAIERRQSEQALHRSEEQYRTLFDSSPVPMVVYDEETLKLQVVNGAMVEHYGYTKRELLSMTILDYRPPEDAELVKRHLSENPDSNNRGFWRHLKKDGKIIVAEVTTARHVFNGRSARTAMLRDVTELIENERRLKEAESQLRQAHKMEAVGRLAGGVAHDFNNLLTVILGVSEMSLATLPKDHEMRPDLEEIRKTGLRAAALTQQLLAFSRRQVISPRRLDLNEAVGTMAKLLDRVIGENIALKVSLASAPVVALADPGHIEQLIMNLAVNARDAMPEGGTLSIETGIVRLDADTALANDALTPGGYATITVTDTGVGISAEVRARLFEPFFTTKEQGKGTGLGLATCYGIAKQNKGGIVCRSEPGHGASFQVLLPLLGEPAAGAESGGPGKALERGCETVLLIEDEATIRKISVRVLTAEGYTALEAGDGEEGLEILRRDSDRRIRLALIDMIMPKLGGVKLAKAVAELRPDVRIVFTTGYTDEAFPGHAPFEFGGDLLRKPYSTRELCGKIRAALDAAPAGG